ncbi:MAG: tetratricopeptide repeat protein, partial [Planctomycetes bacterium]|nr:tetratricopeptide repeat protein [Planctomycetota bacterium]
SVVDGVTLQEGGGDGGGDGDSVPESDPGAGSGQQVEEQLARTYDRVWLTNQSNPFFGLVEVTDAEGKLLDPFDAEKLNDFSNHLVRLRTYSIRKGRLEGNLVVKPGATQPVAKIELADTLRNRIERRKRAIPRDGAHLKERGVLISDLLEWARDDIWVYDEAIEQARFYFTDSGKTLEGLRWIQRVLRARGDLAAEFDLLQNLEQHRETAFRYEGLGRLQARLGLVADAEQNLRKAVQLSPQDARPHAALAELLLALGRSGEAVAAARGAERAYGGLLEDEDRTSVLRTLVACQLAVGDLEGARRVRALGSGRNAPPTLDGAIAYLAGDVEAALGDFQRAAGSVALSRSTRNEAMLGAAACQLRLQRWQEARDGFAEVYDQAPLLRHRAAAGLALLYELIADTEGALAWVDRALEADPEDAYTFYLRGRAMRLAGRLSGAEEAITAALKRHDDFVHAIVEMAKVSAQRAEIELGADQAALALAAMRYSDRAVELSPVKLPELYEFQGLRHMAAADPRGASTAFGSARDAAGSEQRQLFARGALAVVDYGRGRVDDAVAVLQRMSDDLTKDDPFKVWAEATIAAIDDHAQKEMLEDRFERPEIGSIWVVDRGAGVAEKIVGGRLVFDGALTRAGEVTAERVAAIRNGKNFLAVAVKMRLGRRHANACFAGLRVQTEQGSRGQVEFRVELGVRDGEPFLLLVDNKETTRLKQSDLAVAGFDPAAEQELEVRVVPEDEGRTFVLQVSWNGQLLQQRPIKSLGGNTQTELKTVLFAQGNAGNQVDVAFDDYVLERRKER